MSLVQPRELQLLSQGARPPKRLVSLDIVASDRGQFDPCADRFEQCRFARPVFTYEEGHRRIEYDLIEFFDERQIEREARLFFPAGFKLID